jgi:predicted acetyltransferase
MAVEVRTIDKDDLRAWLDAVWTSFGEDLNDDTIERDKRVLEPERILGAYDGDRIVGGGAAFSYQMTVPGGAKMPVAGVTAVGVMPTHRRQGVLRQLMLRQLADVKAAGEPAAILFASEGGIYQRFGYGLASLMTSIDIERERAAFRTAADWSGSVRLIDAAEAARAYPPVHDAVGDVTPGFYVRSPVWWETQILADPQQWRNGASHKFYLLHEREGRPTGYAMYRIKSDWGEVGTKSQLRVTEWMAVDPAATRDVWRYLFGVDLIARIVAGQGPLDHPLPLMLAEPRRLGMRVGDGLWLRIVDVPEALSARSFRSDGDLVLEVVDSVMPQVGGRWRMSVRQGRAEITPTDQPTDLRVDITDLGAVFLGGFSFAQLARAGRGVELVAGATECADRIFATDRAPWCPHVF